MMGEFSPTHWLILLVVFLVLFGARRLPDAARGLGRSVRILKAELAGGREEPASAVASPAPDHRAPAASATTAGATDLEARPPAKRHSTP